MPLKKRILYHYGPGCRDYDTLMQRCFPIEVWPRAWRVATQGGPPGCAIAFGKALRELGIYRDENRRLWMAD